MTNTEQRLLAGAEKLAEYVGSTLGPGGRRVIIEKGAFPIITKDGVTVSGHVMETDPVAKQALFILRQAAQRTVQNAGDGTTTSIVLANELYKRGLQFLDENPDFNVHMLCEDLKNMSGWVCDYIRNNSMEIDSYDTLMEIVSISLNNDRELSKIVTDACSHAGVNGVVSLKMSDSPETYVDKHMGYAFDAGLLHPAMMTDGRLMKAEWDDPLFVFIEDKLDRVDEIMPFIKAWEQLGKMQTQPLVFVVGDIMGDALTSIIRNRQNGLALCAIKAPYFTSQRADVLDDLALLTGADRVWSKRAGHRPKDFSDASQFGKGSKIISNMNSTYIIPAEGTEEAVAQRVAGLQDIIKSSENNAAREFMIKRVAALTSSMSTIHVGGVVASEAEERMMRVDDAKQAAQAAMAEGYVPGAGSMFCMAAEQIKKAGYTSPGAVVISKALTAPYERICANAGISVPQKLKEGYCLRFGDDEWTPAINNNIYDPAKVLTEAISNSVSAVCMLLSCKHVIHE
jgi:chaperonin GroEL